MFSVYFFLVQAETPPAAQQNTFSESLKKARRRPQAPLFSVWIVAKKNWFHQSENHLKTDATHLNKNNILFIFRFNLFYVYFYFLFLF